MDFENEELYLKGSVIFDNAVLMTITVLLFPLFF